MDDETRVELRVLREQMTHDLQVTWRVMGDTDDRILAIASNIEALTREVSEGFRQCQGRLRLVEQRLGTFLEVVEKDLKRQVDRTELQALEVRVKRLEDLRSA